MNKERLCFATWMLAIGWTFVLSGPGLSLGNEEWPKEPVLPMALAQEAANAALTKCEEGGYRVSVAVVDRGGNLKVLLRGDGAGPHTQDSSARKAYTAASIRRSTQELAELIAKIPNLQALRDMNERILILGGGLPVVIGKEVLGGLGVGGAPGTQLDEVCALAGLTSIGAQPSIQ
jgi:uncharacterized protein GlcG (DUF336 family)